MEVREEQYDVGVIVGRFQVPKLHKAHMELLQYVVQKHSKVIVLLGCSPANLSRANPLDFESRAQMLLTEFRELLCLPVFDKYSDHSWSAEVDSAVRGVLAPGQSAVLYGGRESFLQHYIGSFKTKELYHPEASTSGTNIRRDVTRSKARSSEDFRAGVVWGVSNRFDITIPTVDIAILNGDQDYLLLGKKPGESLWRLPGGFLDPTDGSLEAAARREAKEETGVSITDPKYAGSAPVEDWRYQGKDKIHTAIFTAMVLSGSAEAGDDLADVAWFDFPEVREDQLMPNHRPLIKIVEDAFNSGRLQLA